MSERRAPRDESGSGDSRPSPLPSEGRLLALDIGQRRIGLAVSDPTQTVSQPLATLTRRAGKRFPIRALLSHVEAQRAVGVVIGLPVSPGGTEDERAAQARAVGTLVHEKTHLPIDFWDERMTTARVLATAKEMGSGTRGRKEDIDRLAATVLLQTYLESRRP